MHLAQNSEFSEEKTFNFQNELRCLGVNLGATFIGDYFSNLSGGIKSNGAYLNNIIFDVGLDMEKIGRINGMSIYISGLGIYGGFPIENSGAIQGISNIAGVNHWRLYEAWIEQNLFENNFSFLFGLFDLNSEFDARESSGIFVNPSFGIGFDFAQSGQNGPSIFPYTSLALRFKYNVSNSFELLAAVFDGVPGSLVDEESFNVSWNKDEGALLAAELIYCPGKKEFGVDYSKFSIGGWYYTSAFENTAEDRYKTGNYGIYINGEQFVYSEDLSPEQGLAVFGRFGIANSNFNPSDYSILGGINYTGLIPGRNDDVFGLAFSSIHLSDEFRNETKFEQDFETVLELTYSIQLVKWMSLQPDLQYIFNPVAAPQSDYAFTAGLRAAISF